jgi:hypothetical protein
MFDGALRLDSNSKRSKVKQYLNKIERYDFREYLRKVSEAKYVLSLAGDRPDCYRMWESIGLGTVPVTNLNKTLYYSLFGNRVIYTTTEDAVKSIQFPAINRRHRSVTDPSFVELHTWRLELQNKQRLLKPNLLKLSKKYGR